MSTVFLPGAVFSPTRHVLAMDINLDLPEILARIDERLEAKGLTANAASHAAGKPDAIRNIRRAVESGSRKGVSIITLNALAPVLGTTVIWLMTGYGGPQMVQVLGYAAATDEDALTFYGDAQGPLDEVEAPAGATDKTVAIKIRGNSLGHLFDGALAFYDDRRSPPDETHIGRICVCGLDNDRVFIKVVRASLTKGRYHLESVTAPTMYDQTIMWAARVWDIKPR